MKNHYIFIANWKMHLSFTQAIAFATKNFDELVSLAGQTTIILCPSHEALFPLTEIFKTTPIAIGAQNCSDHLTGPFTGQVSAQSLHELGCTYCIIGHSESRSNTNMALACNHLLSYNITPICCIGETEQEKKEGKTLEILEQQLTPILNTSCYIAYEPVWSIGTGSLASIDQLATIYTWLEKKVTRAKLLYGGSVTEDNVNSLKKITQIQGFLIGKSSLDFQAFKKIVH